MGGLWESMEELQMLFLVAEALQCSGERRHDQRKLRAEAE